MTRLQFRAYEIVSRAVEEGVKFGLMHAYKHTESPTQDHLTECVEREVMLSLDEVIDFGEGDEAQSVPLDVQRAYMAQPSAVQNGEAGESRTHAATNLGLDSPSSPAPIPHATGEDHPTYPCVECGVARTKEQGGTTFTVCDECWEKAHPKPTTTAYNGPSLSNAGEPSSDSLPSEAAWPSLHAMAIGLTKFWGAPDPHGEPFFNGLRAAYAIDLPRIRAEEVRAFAAWLDAAAPDEGFVVRSISCPDIASVADNYLRERGVA